MNDAELDAYVEERESMARESAGVEVRRTLREAAAWRYLAELVRRHPRLQIREGHGGGGQYDELVLWDPEVATTPVRMNYEGGIHLDLLGPRYERFSWTELLAEDPRALVARTERVTGLASPPAVPRSTPEVLTYRAIAHLLAVTALDREGRQMVNGPLSASGFGDGKRETVCEEVTSIGSQSGDSAGASSGGLDGWGFWSACHPAPWHLGRFVPVLAFETTGHAWKPGEDAGERFDFVRMYDTVGRDFDRLMAAFDTWRAAG